MDKLKRISHISYYDRRVRAGLFSYCFSSLLVVIIENFAAIDYMFIRFCLLTIICYFVSGWNYYKYSLQGCILGLATGSIAVAGMHYGYDYPRLGQFCIYAFVFCMFHFSEFYITSISNNESLRPDTFLLNHSVAYWTAAVSSWAEFWIEAYLFPNFYSSSLCYLGLSMCIIGEIFRKLAMCHASSGFTHQVAVRRQKNHTLITSGVYGIVRHPGYLGWFLWSVGTQLILCNPICIFAYTYTTFQFFDDRIYDEERYLIEFFGQRYVHYQRQVPIGIPGIKGYLL